jgi:hypothetical protein
MKTLYVECGCCGYYHAPEFTGDCRDDKNRFSADQIEAMYGDTVWDSVWTIEDQEDAEGQDRESYSDDQDRESYSEG